MLKSEKHLFHHKKKAFSGVLFSSFDEEILSSSNITDAIAAYTLTCHCYFVIIVPYFPTGH